VARRRAFSNEGDVQKYLLAHWRSELGLLKSSLLNGAALMRQMLRGVFHVAIVMIAVHFLVPEAMADIRVMQDRQITGVFIYHDKQHGYVLGTASDHGLNIPLFVNQKFNKDGWISQGDALPVLPVWAQKGQTWRPQMIRLTDAATGKDRFLLYFSARTPSENGTHCIGVATSGNALGPYQSPGQTPLICVHGREAIDPAPFLDDDGTLYLSWKLGGRMREYQPTINLNRLTADGLQIAGPATVLITNDAPWEGMNVEAPFLMKRHGTYYLFYSGNLFQTPRYGIGYATSSKVTGPYVKSTANPLVVSNETFGFGPGEELVFSDSCGNEWLGFSDYDQRDAVGPPHQRHFHAVHLLASQNSAGAARGVSLDARSDFAICP